MSYYSLCLKTEHLTLTPITETAGPNPPSIPPTQWKQTEAPARLQHAALAILNREGDHWLPISIPALEETVDTVDTVDTMETPG